MQQHIECTYMTMSTSLFSTFPFDLYLVQILEKADCQQLLHPVIICLAEEILKFSPLFQLTSLMLEL